MSSGRDICNFFAYLKRGLLSDIPTLWQAQAGFSPTDAKPYIANHIQSQILNRISKPEPKLWTTGNIYTIYYILEATCCIRYLYILSTIYCKLRVVYRVLYYVPYTVYNILQATNCIPDAIYSSI